MITRDTKVIRCVLRSLLAICMFSGCPLLTLTMASSAVALDGASPAQAVPPEQSSASTAKSGEAPGSAKQSPKPGEPADAAGAPPTQGKPDESGSKQRSLDDLLGVPGNKEDEKKGADEAADREQAKRLERSLDEASLDDLVARAVDGMKSAAQRLSEAKDPGLGTQRIQEDVVKTLDRLLDEAQKQQKRPSSSSSSRSKGKPRPEQGEEPKPDKAQQSSSRQQKSDQRQSKGSSNSEDNSDANRPPDQSAPDGTALDESRIEWGQLPERVRELVLQGRRDRVSTIYERLTREYYRRLAEEASK